VPPTVVALHLNKVSRAPLEQVDRVQALLEQGLEGDRHARPGARRSVLLMEQEVLDDFGLAPGAVREQVTVRGLSLGPLVFGSRLGIGSTVLEVAGPCAPCERMNELGPGLKTRLEGRRGRFAKVVVAGSFAVGDSIAVLPPATTPAG
jgi:MOSC domain-containing protein YiiM